PGEGQRDRSTERLSADEVLCAVGLDLAQRAAGEAFDAALRQIRVMIERGRRPACEQRGRALHQQSWMTVEARDHQDARRALIRHRQCSTLLAACPAWHL